MKKEERAARVLEQWSEALSRLPNVVGVGIIEIDKGDAGREAAVAVYVSRKVPRGELADDELVPERLGVEEGEEVDTRVIEIGHVSPEGAESGGFQKE